MKNSPTQMNVQWHKGKNRPIRVGKHLTLEALERALGHRFLTRVERRALEKLTKPRKRA
jgi:hypothetical protein